MTVALPILVPANDLIALVSRIFVAAGMAEKAATKIAEGLVQADLEAASHGALLVDMHIDIAPVHHHA
jgi:LDH2 family malate/lactate/ureidoglycolate dehydrogenase